MHSEIYSIHSALQLLEVTSHAFIVSNIVYNYQSPKEPNFNQQKIINATYMHRRNPKYINEEALYRLNT